MSLGAKIRHYRIAKRIPFSSDMTGKLLLLALLILGLIQNTACLPQDVAEAAELLRSHGLSVCHPYDDRSREDVDLLPSCTMLVNEHRILEDPAGGEEEGEEEENIWMNVVGTVCCVSVAALAAGLTLGLLGLDPLMLLIKERAAVDPQEREIARNLLPIVQQHHRLLVTLLLMNACANEALPIFLEALVPPSMAILVSVTLVLFFGEIIPAAIFTGPNQMQIANFLSPVVKFAMFVLTPLAWPIAKLLDHVLHHDEDGSSAYNRGELSALIRIQFEERMAAKRRRRTEKASVLGDDVVAASMRHTKVTEEALRATVRQLDQQAGRSERPGLQRSPSIHIDEVTMVEGALQMKTKKALDVFTPLRKVFSIPSDMCLTEKNLVRIYASGHSRVPVYQPTENAKDKTKVLGILITKQLIVVDSKDDRPVSTLPLYTPLCVSHAMSLVDLLNKMQTGESARQGGHMALVCARPSVANEALLNGEPIPDAAGLMGVITLEDVLEMLLQEQIYDEMDKDEKNTHRLVQMVIGRWRRYVARKKAGDPTLRTGQPALLSVVNQAVATSGATETTGLLGK